MKKGISVSTASLAKFEDKPPYGFLGTFKTMERILERKAVDGFELLYKPEWDGDPPLSQKDMIDYKAQEVLLRLQREQFPVFSVHARKDIGVYLCSSSKRDFRKGKRLIHDCLAFAEALNVEDCVFHLWDTFSTSFDLDLITNAFIDTASQFPRLRASVENIPTSVEGNTPFDLVKDFKYLTLDTRWATAYNEFSNFESITDKIVNIHLRGELRGEKWCLDNSSFEFYGVLKGIACALGKDNSSLSFCEVLKTIRKKWNYSRLLTMEPDGALDGSRFDSFLEALRSLRIARANSRYLEKTTAGNNHDKEELYLNCVPCEIPRQATAQSTSQTCDITKTHRRR